MTKIILHSHFLLTITISFLKCGVLELNCEFLGWSYWVGCMKLLHGHILWKICHPNFAQKRGVSWKPLWILTKVWTKPPGRIELALSIQARFGFGMLKNQMCNKRLIDRIDEFDFVEISFDCLVAYPFFKREQLPSLGSRDWAWS